MPMAGMRSASREAVGERGAHQQGAGQPRALGVADAVNSLNFLLAASRTRRVSGHEPADVVARGELGHHAAVGLVHRHLRVHGVRQQAPRRAPSYRATPVSSQEVSMPRISMRIGF